jgi:hypothetical protein
MTDQELEAKAQELLESGEVEIRICRIGDRLSVFSRGISEKPFVYGFPGVDRTEPIEREITFAQSDAVLGATWDEGFMGFLGNQIRRVVHDTAITKGHSEKLGAKFLQAYDPPPEPKERLAPGEWRIMPDGSVADGVSLEQYLAEGDS